MFGSRRQSAALLAGGRPVARKRHQFRPGLEVLEDRRLLATAVTFSLDGVDIERQTTLPYTLGWSFTTNNRIVVDRLGVYDDNGDGLSESHLVGIWDSARNLLVQATVGSGNSA